MARKLRLEYPGAIYHVINRGNYRRDVFESVGAAQSFVQTMEEAVALYGWRLQAYVLMSNHFHLVVETPDANLTEGMHWLMSTTATRFNRFRQERATSRWGQAEYCCISGLIRPQSCSQYPHGQKTEARIPRGDLPHHQPR